MLPSKTHFRNAYRNTNMKPIRGATTGQIAGGKDKGKSCGCPLFVVAYEYARAQGYSLAELVGEVETRGLHNTLIKFIPGLTMDESISFIRYFDHDLDEEIHMFPDTKPYHAAVLAKAVRQYIGKIYVVTDTDIVF